MSQEITLITKSPNEYSSQEFDQILSLILSGEEVSEAGLRRRVENCERIVTIFEDNIIVGVAALKRPLSSYRDKIQQKAGVSLHLEDYPYELGYIVVSKTSRGRGYSIYLVNAALSEKKESGVFAASRHSNKAMHKTLDKFNFEKVGQRYLSENKKSEIQLFLRSGKYYIESDIVSESSPDKLIKTRDALLSIEDQVDTPELLPALVPEASELVSKDPYAFVIGVCLDRGTKAEIIWTVPYYIQQDLGHLNPLLIYKMSLDELANLFSRLPKRPRYINAAPKTLQELTRTVVEEYGGDTEEIWKGKRAAEVNRTFQSIFGVGPGIANMGVLLIESTFGVRFEDLDRRGMDIKPDVHTVRVLYRLGASEELSETSAIEATRRMNPEFPGALDGPLWWIGKKWCYATNPDCSNCPMNQVCQKVSL